MGEINIIIIIVLSLFALVSCAALAFVFFGRSNTQPAGQLRGLMGESQGVGATTSSIQRGAPIRDELDVEAIKLKTGSARVKKAKVEDINNKLFKAGIYSARERKNFHLARVMAPFIAVALCGGTMVVIGNTMLAVSGLIIGAFIGYALPMSWLERQVRKRQDVTMYYLPLVIEQISIGVSSSLDIGPCISHVIQMANERDSHNPVTEMFIHVEKLLRSGLNLESALEEVGSASGLNGVKHAFMFLGQCAKHGGEISKQLQELADSVMVQRRVQIEGKIAALPVKATGPLVCVFAGFFALLFAGLFVRLMTAFGG